MAVETLNPSFYRGKRVFVTGHTGFQGGWLVAWLKLLEAQVCGYGLPPATRPNFFDATVLDRGITSIFADIRDRNALAGAFAELQPEIVIHCAAQDDFDSMNSDPVQTFSTNVMGTVHILEEARQTDSVRAVVVASRARAYSGSGWHWGRGREVRFDASDPTSSSRAGAELAVSAYVKAFFSGKKTAVAVARTGGLIGGGDWAQGRFIPRAVRAITSEQPLVVHGTSPAPYQHVLEAARAYLLVAQKLYEGGQSCSGAWNLTPPEADVMTSEHLAKAFAYNWGDVELRVESTDDPNTGSAFGSGSASSNSELDWKPFLPLSQAIAWTAEWYRSYYADPASALRVTADQINRYMRRQ